jgi:hypothetical protein
MRVPALASRARPVLLARRKCPRQPRPAEQDDLTRSVGLCRVSVTANCKQCDGAEVREARGARRLL